MRSTVYLPDPRALVVLPAGTPLDPGRRNLVGGLSHLPRAVLHDLAQKRLPVVIEAPLSPELARARAAALTAAHHVPFVGAHPGGALPTMTRTASLLVALFPLGLAALTFLVGLWPLTLLSLVAAAGIYAVGSWFARMASGGNFRDGLVALTLIRSARAAHGVDGPFAADWDRLFALRMEVARADLPAAAQSDLHSALAALETSLEDLARQPGAASDAEVIQVRSSLRELSAAVAAVGADATEARLDSLGRAALAARAGARLER